MSEARESMDPGLGKLRAAGRNLWLAGLGAVAEVEEGGRELFDRLVERGKPLEGKQKKLTEKVTERANKAARDLGKRVEETVGFESRGVLRKLNLMTREDVEILSARLETLSQKIDEYAVRHEAAESSKKTVAGPVRKAKTTQSKKTVAKKG
ncbi:MAG TPA: phasin family protein [Thermoanaerobaculia bacterium]|nr:phasin family protein [Thermoanaerobaculia bacterium]